MAAWWDENELDEECLVLIVLKCAEKQKTTRLKGVPGQGGVTEGDRR